MGRIVLENLIGGGFEGALHRRQSQSSPRARAALARIAACDRNAGRPRADRDAGCGGRRRARRCGACGRRRRRSSFRRRRRTLADAKRWQASLAARLRRRAGSGCSDRTRSASSEPTSDSTRRSAARSRTPAGSRSSRSRARCAPRCSISRRRSTSAFRRWSHWVGRSTWASASCWTRWSSTRRRTASCSMPKRSATRGASCRHCAPRRGRSLSSCCGQGGRWSRSPIDAPSPDAVFDAAMRRAGTVRVKTYTQLFAAARILAMHRIARGDRLAIVTNGHGPGTLAADSAADRGIALADLSPATKKVARGSVCRPMSRVAIRSMCAAMRRRERVAAAVEAALADDGVDAVLALHVPRPVMGATDAARAVAAVAARSTKPVLAAWLGAVDRREAGGRARSGRRRQLLHAGERGGSVLVPRGLPPSSGMAARSASAATRAAAAGSARGRAPAHRRRIRETHRVDAKSRRNTLLVDVLAAGAAVAVSADTLAEAIAAARRLGYPVTLRSGTSESAPDPQVCRSRTVRVRDSRMLTRAWAAMHGCAQAGGRKRGAVDRGEGAGAFDRDRAPSRSAFAPTRCSGR